MRDNECIDLTSPSPQREASNSTLFKLNQSIMKIDICSPIPSPTDSTIDVCPAKIRSVLSSDYREPSIEIKKKSRGQGRKKRKEGGLTKAAPKRWNILQAQLKGQGYSNYDMLIRYHLQGIDVTDDDQEKHLERRNERLVEADIREAEIKRKKEREDNDEPFNDPSQNQPLTQQGRLPRELCDGNEPLLKGFYSRWMGRGKEGWIQVHSKRSRSELINIKKRIPIKPGVYEWGIETSLFGGEKKIVAIYCGKSENTERGLRARFAKYCREEDFVGPRDNDIDGSDKFEAFLKLQRDEGMTLWYRCKLADEGKSAEKMEEELLKRFDYPFNHNDNAGYRFKFYDEAKSR